MNPHIAKLLGNKAPAPAPESPKTEPASDVAAKLEETLKDLGTVDNVNPPESKAALAESLAPAPIEGAKARGKARKPAAPAPTPAPSLAEPGFSATAAEGEIAYVESLDSGEVRFNVISKAWPTSKKVILTFV